MVNLKVDQAPLYTLIYYFGGFYTYYVEGKSLSKIINNNHNQNIYLMES